MRPLRLRARIVAAPWILIAALCAACGAPPPGAGGAATAAPADATAGPTAVPRTSDPQDIILATTTSTQDSGLLDELIPRFEQRSGFRVKVVAVGSGAAIALGTRGEADIVLAHAPDSERELVASGSGVDRQLVMYNDFVLVGPPDDPAKIGGGQDALAALAAIARAEAPFVSRGDNSGTEQLERKLWAAAGIDPAGQSWYVQSGSGMGQTLQIAGQRRAYTLSDRGTYLAFRERVELAVLVEQDARLLNVYHVIRVNPERFPLVNAAGAQALSDFLLAPETQAIIATFGQEAYGQPLFTPCAQNSCGLAPDDA